MRDASSKNPFVGHPTASREKQRKAVGIRMGFPEFSFPAARITCELSALNEGHKIKRRPSASRQREKAAQTAGSTETKATCEGVTGETAMKS